MRKLRGEAKKQIQVFLIPKLPSSPVKWAVTHPVFFTALCKAPKKESRSTLKFFRNYIQYYETNKYQFQGKKILEIQIDVVTLLSDCKNLYNCFKTRFNNVLLKLQLLDLI